MNIPTDFRVCAGEPRCFLQKRQTECSSIGGCRDVKMERIGERFIKYNLNTN